MANPDQAIEDRAKQLLARRDDLSVLQDEWRVVEDVIDGPSKLRGETYLPKHMSEHADEYKKRVRLTPVFTETPGIMQARQGGMFRKPWTVKVPASLVYLLTKASLGGSSVNDLIVKAAEFCQVQGFCGALLDRPPLPADVKDRSVSVEEAQQRKLGETFIALYPAAQILAWASDARGLLWVKLIETCERASAWDAKPVKVHTIRIVDRISITVYEVTERPDEKQRYVIAEHPPVPHGRIDADSQPCVPFRFFHPFAAKDNIGRPILKASAEADAAALWVLSELLWFAYMLCPILTLTTDRDEEDIGKMPIGASRFIPLKSKTPNSEEEKLAFVALDATAIDKLMQIWDRLVSKAKAAGGKESAAAVTGPVEQSGVSKAWTFKTTEERIMFLLAFNLQAGFQWLLELAERGTGKEKSEGCSVSFPETFDIEAPADAVSQALEQAERFQAFGVNGAVMQLLLRAAEAALPNLDTDAWDEIEKQILALKDRELRPGSVLDKALKPNPAEPETGKGAENGA